MPIPVVAVLVPPIDLLSPILEYLYLPAVRMQYASEFGHLIRILTIFAKMEYILDELNGRFYRFLDVRSS
jgi:hypothetical protein